MATPTATGQIPARYSRRSRDPLLNLCRDYYKISETQYEFSIKEGKEIMDMYHNRQYTQAQITKLKSQGSPIETFNVIKMFTNAMIGYLETIVTKATAEPLYPAVAANAAVMNDVLQFTFDDNDWESQEKFIKVDGLLLGLMCAYEEVIPTGAKDAFGREINKVEVEHVPAWQVRIDPQSTKEDYSDARFIHHFKWMPESAVKEAWPRKWKELTEYYNYLDEDSAEYARVYQQGHDTGKYKDYDNYLITKTIVKNKGKYYTVIWHDEVMLEKKEITFKQPKFPYRVVKMSYSDEAEYYGPFREIVETQKAINQALVQIQLMVNTSKALVEEGAVDDIEEFKELFNRVNAVIPVTSLQGIKIEDMSRDVVQQYSIIDQALSRIKMVLGVNDSFLGSAYASDSGRKVQIQQMASASQLTMIVDRVGHMFKFVGEDIVALVKQYYRGTQVIKIADPLNSYHYTTINAPIMMPTGEMDPETFEPVMQPVIVPSLDPATLEPEVDDNGQVIMIPLNDPKTDVQFSDTDLKIVSSKGDNSDERNQLLFETFTNGPMGQTIMQFDPAGAVRIMAMQISEYGTKHSIEIARILMEISFKLSNGEIDPTTALQGVGTDVQAMMGGAMGGSTGNVQNMPRSGQQPGNPGNVPQIGNEGGMPPQGGM